MYVGQPRLCMNLDAQLNSLRSPILCMPSVICTCTLMNVYPHLNCVIRGGLGVKFSRGKRNYLFKQSTLWNCEDFLFLHSQSTGCFTYVQMIFFLPTNPLGLRNSCVYITYFSKIRVLDAKLRPLTYAHLSCVHVYSYRNKEKTRMSGGHPVFILLQFQDVRQYFWMSAKKLILWFFLRIKSY
jgi:hypothetical protein